MKTKYLSIFLRQGLMWTVAIAVTMLMSRCTAFDDYKQYLDGGEKIYPQKADSLQTFPGRNRVLLQWLTIDPKVKEYKIIYRQSGQIDSLTVPAIHTGSFNADTMRVYIDGLEEAGYTFRIVSYDTDRNASIPVEKDETVYGDIYESYLIHRGLGKAILTDGKLNLQWYAPSDGEIGVELRYKSIEGDTKKLWIPDSVQNVTINDFADYDEENMYINYRTLYKPTENAIDTFASPSTTVSQSTLPSTLTNNVAPFAVDENGLWVWGRFGTVAGWKCNEATGGLTVDGGSIPPNLLTMIVGWGVNDNQPIINGKIHQTLSLEAGTYRFRVNGAHLGADPTRVYTVVAKGNDLPNTDVVETSDLMLAYCLVPVTNQVTAFDCVFVLTEKTTVSLGVVANLYPDVQMIMTSLLLDKF
jgi:hypothetical protein